MRTYPRRGSLLRRRPAPLRLTSRSGSGATVPMTGLLTRVPSGQQLRCLVVRVFRGALSFGDDVTPIAYQVLIDRRVIVAAWADGTASRL